MSHQSTYNQLRRPELRITSRGKLAALGLTAVTAVGAYGAYHVDKGIDSGLSRLMGDGPTVQQLETMPTKKVVIPAEAGADYAINQVDPQIYANGQIRSELEGIIQKQAPDGVLQPEETVKVPVINPKG